MTLHDRVIAALKTVYDPEMPVNIYELGLIYSLTVQPGGEVEIRMTLTAPNCPVAGSLPGDVERAVRNGRITLNESKQLLRFYETGLDGYTYLEE